jgi:lipopolysaccharide/colanic/teichoic acid biosynthesis glycosyltransferase
MMFYRNIGKRMFDLVCASLALIILSPLLLLVALLVKIKLGSPVIFWQRRPGRHAQLFTLFKFRSMSDAKDADGRMLPDDLRLTRLGRFLRASSIDELPELFNVLRGEMSLVGPRPLLIEYLDRYTPEQSRRHEVRPGITGWAQVNGRQDIPFSKRFLLDVEYVNNCSFMLDIRILFITFFRLHGAGVRSGQDVLEVDDIGLSDMKDTSHRRGVDA